MTTLIDCVREIGFAGILYSGHNKKTASRSDIFGSFSLEKLSIRGNLEEIIRPKTEGLVEKSEIKEAISSVTEPIKKAVKDVVDLANKFKENTITSVKSAFKNLYDTFIGYAKSAYGAVKRRVKVLSKGESYNVEGSRVKGNEGKFAETPGSPNEMRERYLEITNKIPLKLCDVETYQRLELKKAHLGGPF